MFGKEKDSWRGASMYEREALVAQVNLLIYA